MVSTRKRVAVVSAAKIITSGTPAKKIKKTVPHPLIHELLQKSGIVHTTTKGGWCLQEGMRHVLETDTSGQLSSIVQQNGLPNIYSIVQNATCRHEEVTPSATTTSKPENCFQSLCRIIAGQQLAGAAARAMWQRLVRVVETTTTDAQLTPAAILSLAEQGIESHLQKPAGLSGAKARSIVALAEAFHKGTLTESFLTAPTSTEESIRDMLLPIKGIGPWTCDMFLMFYLEKENVLPVGDLGVRKGIAKFFGLKGRGYKGSLCQVKDKEVIEGIMSPYRPYQSLIAYYMWAVADTKDFYRDTNRSEDRGLVSLATPSRGENKKSRKGGVVTP